MQGIAPSASDSSSERLRLHITPFNSDLLDKIIAPSIQPLVNSVSFHTVQTFPERGFGYVELPAVEAQKLKKKFNNMTLKGSKVRIEDAKPERKRKPDGEDDEEEAAERKVRRTERKEKKRKVESVIPGHELAEGRRVKRGWEEADAGSRSSRTKDKSSKKSEEVDDSLTGKKLRFKTTIPPNATDVKEEGKKGTKSKKGKDGKGSKNNAVVEEFRKTTKLRVGGAAQVDRTSLSYEDGRGWVDQAGNIVEEEPTSRKPKSKDTRSGAERRISAIESQETVDQPIPHQATEDSESSEAESPESPSPADAAIATDSGVEAEVEKEVHPLEALFKRPALKSPEGAKPRPAPIDTSFSFFDGPAAEDEDAAVDMPPQTPHTKRDMEWRSIRSAAPTPDTAAIGRHFSFPFARGVDEDEDEDENVEAPKENDVNMLDVERPNVPNAAGDGHNGGEESALRRFFYENRGDLNRGWKKQRRDDKKADRQRENRRMSRRIL